MTKINTLSTIVLFTHKKSNNLKPILDSLPSIKKRKIFIVSDPEQNEMEKLFVKETKELIQTHPQSFFFEWIIPPTHQGVLHIFDYALDIVFEKEKQAIILEDDTIPSPNFFKYCEQMLEKFENNLEIGSIIGTNLGALHDAEMYCTVPIGMPFWGWATWADRWKSMPKDYSFWDRFILTENYNDLNTSILKPLLTSFDNNRKVPKSWDLKWAMYQLSKGMECVIPGSNLISNKGYSNLATFTKIENSEFENLPIDSSNYSNTTFQKSDQKLKHNFFQKQLVFLNEFANRKTPN